MQRRNRPAGTAYRVADPSWTNPLDPSFARRRGGRWTPPGSFDTLYLAETVGVARLHASKQIMERLAGMPYTLADLDPAEMPVLLKVDVPDTVLCNCRTSRGLVSAGLPASYPVDAADSLVGWDACQPVGAAVHAAGVHGITARSAAPGATRTDRELVLFPDHAPPVHLKTRTSFLEWYGAARGAGT